MSVTSEIYVLDCGLVPDLTNQIYGIPGPLVCYFCTRTLLSQAGAGNASPLGRYVRRRVVFFSQVYYGKTMKGQSW